MNVMTQWTRSMHSSQCDSIKKKTHYSYKQTLATAGGVSDHQRSGVECVWPRTEVFFIKVDALTWSVTEKMLKVWHRLVKVIFAKHQISQHLKVNQMFHSQNIISFQNEILYFWWWWWYNRRHWPKFLKNNSQGKVENAWLKGNTTFQALNSLPHHYSTCLTWSEKSIQTSNRIQLAISFSN